MPSNVKHQFTSAKADDPDATLVNPSNWNDEHVGALEIMDRDLSQQDIANDDTEQSVYSHQIPAGQLGTTGGFRLTLVGDLLCNVPAATIVIKVKLGATTVFTSTALDITDSADRYKWQLDILCMNSAADAQKWAAKILGAASADNFPMYVGSNAGVFHGAGHATSTEDTAGALTLDVTVDWSASNANLSVRKEMAILEEIPAA